MNNSLEPKELSIESIRHLIENLQKDKEHVNVFKHGNALYLSGMTQLLSTGGSYFELTVEDEYKNHQTTIEENDGIIATCTCKAQNWCSHEIASLLQIAESLSGLSLENMPSGKAYTREGMIKRVLEERQTKAKKANYKVVFSENKYGEHTLLNERGIKYNLTLRDFENERGYCNCLDHKSNKLGTCKHLIYTFSNISKKLKKQKHEFPFIDVYLDPLNDYKITWYYPETLAKEYKSLLSQFFGANTFIENDNVINFLGFIKKAEDFKLIKIRPEVLDKIESVYDQHILDQLASQIKLDYNVINAQLYPYQQQGVEFAIFKPGAIIADEMGLGKTIQAITTAVFKKKYLGFKKTLIICPASLKGQWKAEIEKFSNEEAIIIEGFPNERQQLYNNNTAYFNIINYETVLRDIVSINQSDYDFVVLDEAQRIKNFETVTASAIKAIKKKHALVITGTPIENHLIDLYSIVEFLYPAMLTPLWEFSYQHCYFDTKNNNKITGYYNLQELKERIQTILIRREKGDVLSQLNKLTQIDVPVEMHPIQQDYHASAGATIASILHKKYKTAFDWQRMLNALQTMRMACDSSFLVDKETYHSPKLEELKEILFEKLDLNNNKRKIIIFSEWRTMNGLIGKMLRENNIGYTELNGKVPVKNRKNLITEFENNDKCRVFLSTEAGGSGLNLQVADTVINFELPWNPAKKNQRIGRIDRLGQTNKNLTVINLITRNSIEMKIASGLVVKQNLFDNVLNKNYNEDIVDFSDQGKSQFLKELELALEGFVQTKAATIEDDELLQLAEESKKQAAEKSEETKERIKKLEEMEAVMQKGMQFLSGLFKMSTGHEMSEKDSKIEIDKETGEVIMRFKF